MDSEVFKKMAIIPDQHYKELVDKYAKVHGTEDKNKYTKAHTSIASINSHKLQAPTPPKNIVPISKELATDSDSWIHDWISL